MFTEGRYGYNQGKVPCHGLLQDEIGSFMCLCPNDKFDLNVEGFCFMLSDFKPIEWLPPPSIFVSFI